MFIIESTWDTVNRWWDGGMWKPSQERARPFPTRAEAEACVATMTWVDPSVQPPENGWDEESWASRVKPVTDVEIVEVEA